MPPSPQEIFGFYQKKLLKTNALSSNCQFSIQFDNKLKELEEDELLTIEILTGKLIQSKIIISAGCNQESDHNILAELTAEISRKIGGWIDYCGDLNIYQQGIAEALSGQVYSIEYNNGLAAYQISDVAFLEHWIRHPNFRMIK